MSIARRDPGRFHLVAGGGFGALDRLLRRLLGFLTPVFESLLPALLPPFVAGEFFSIGDGGVEALVEVAFDSLSNVACGALALGLDRSLQICS